MDSPYPRKLTKYVSSILFHSSVEYTCPKCGHFNAKRRRFTTQAPPSPSVVSERDVSPLAKAQTVDSFPDGDVATSPKEGELRLRKNKTVDGGDMSE